MRQAGILAAAGLIALDNRRRLGDDHTRAKRLLEGLLALGYQAWAPSVATNMVMIDTNRAAEGLVQEARKAGVAFGTVGTHRIRLVTHQDVDDSDIDRTLAVFRGIKRSLSDAG